MYNGINCIDRRIDKKLQEQQQAIEEGRVLAEEESKECGGFSQGRKKINE